MRLARLVPALLLGTLAAPAFADYITYNEWRQEKPSIGQAIAALPNSDFNGSLNRLSALLDRSAIEALQAGDANVEGALPGNWDDQMERAIDDLRSDWKDVVDLLSLEQKYTLLQVFDVVLVSRTVELYDGYEDVPCTPSPEHPCPADPRPAVIIELDSLLGGLRTEMNALLTAYNDMPDTSDEDLILVPITNSNFSIEMDRIRSTYGSRAIGVESIDD